MIQASFGSGTTTTRPVAQPKPAPAPSNFWAHAPRPEMMPGASQAAAQAKPTSAPSNFWAHAPRPEMMPGGTRNGAVQAKSGGTIVQLSPNQLSPAVLRTRGGQPLPSSVRRQMESLLGADLSGVRVHQGQLARAIGAEAITVGDDIHFASGRYQPGKREGMALLAKQLTYVVQQRAGMVQNPHGRGVVLVRDPQLDAQAEQVAAIVSSPGAALQAKRMPGARGIFQVKTTARGIGHQHLDLYEHGQPVGSADVVLERGDAKLYNLNIQDDHRGRGGGEELLRAAAMTSGRVGKQTLRLEAQDDGSGRLTRWYQKQGFQPIGTGRDGMPALEARVQDLKRR